MIIPGPEIEKRIGKTEQQDGRQPDPLIYRQAAQQRTKSQPGSNIEKDLRFDQRDHFGAEDLKEQRGDHPIHAPERSTEIPERQLPAADPVSAFPGKENIHPVRIMGEKGNTGQSDDNQ